MLEEFSQLRVRWLIVMIKKSGQICWQMYRFLSQFSQSNAGEKGAREKLSQWRNLMGDEIWGILHRRRPALVSEKFQCSRPIELSWRRRSENLIALSPWQRHVIVTDWWLIIRLLNRQRRRPLPSWNPNSALPANVTAWLNWVARSIERFVGV